MKKRKPRKNKALERSWNELLKKHKSRPFGTSDQTIRPRTSGIPDYASIGTRMGRMESSSRVVERKHTASYTGPSVEKERYEGELLHREVEAQKEIERKKKRVGIAYNKGAYQFLTDETDPKTIGRK